jgi:prepilin-type N-terminal cleavage/methylation domain-containing protein
MGDRAKGADMKRVQPRQLAQGGFTLIEVLIGISIFAIGMLAVARMQMHSVRNTTVGNITSQATMLANQKMEELKTLSFDDLNNEVENNLDAEGNPGGIYNRTTTITTPAAPLGDHVRQIQVQVQWNAAHSGNRTIAINSLTYERW